MHLADRRQLLDTLESDAEVLAVAVALGSYRNRVTDRVSFQDMEQFVECTRRLVVHVRDDISDTTSPSRVSSVPA